MKKIAIFGGTFNPIHNGHLNLCKEIDSMIHFDEILLIPTNIPPHKASIDLASNEDRLNMLKLATLGHDKFKVSDIEYKLTGTSYTYNTIQELKKTVGKSELYLIVGSDMLKIFDQWYRYEEILDDVILVVGARHQEEYEELLEIKKSKFGNTNRILIENSNVYEMTSTKIRNAFKNGISNDGWLPEAVQCYIKAHKLYL